MFFPKRLTLLVGLPLALIGIDAAPTSKPIVVPASAPEVAGVPLSSFVSYSIEFAYFPDYAGNASNPNNFSYNLLKNIGDLSGSNPIVRVGGNTQDSAVFDASQSVGLTGIFNTAVSNDFPSQVSIGPAFFESYSTWPDIKFSHGLDLRNDSSVAKQATLDSIPFACKALQDKLVAWEYGNEPDIYYATNERPNTYDEQAYVDEWRNGTRAIQAAVKTACPDMASIKFLGPSFYSPIGGSQGAIFTLDAVKTWKAGFDADQNVGFISQHSYMGIATALGTTLQGTLMNHTNVVAVLAPVLNDSRVIAALPKELNPGVPYILGEHNILAQQGSSGLSNSFGAALWNVDYNVYAAANNIGRSHMHQGLNYRYQAWQPIETSLTAKGTKAPYYGDVTVAAFLSNKNGQKLQISELPLNSDFEAAYSAYTDGILSRTLVVNLREYNASAWNSAYTSTSPRPSTTYKFKVPKKCRGNASIQRLMANGSDALTGITFNGYSYNYELANGEPVLLSNVTSGETVAVAKNGKVSVTLPWSSAAILSFTC